MNSMKQTGCRNMAISVEMMEWNNKMDLLAIGNTKGEVIVQRLNWQKIVTFPPAGENVTICSLSWQPDESMLAVCYSNCRVSLFDVEKGQEVFVHKLDEEVNNAYWSKAIKADDYRQTYRNRAELCHEFFLPPLPNLNSLFSSIKTTEDYKSYARGFPCLLVVTTNSGKVLLFIMGVLRCGSIDLRQHVSHPDDFNVYDVRLSGNCDSIYAFVRDGHQLKLLHFQNEVLGKYTSPILNLSSQYGFILETKNYINETIQCITEAWETVLMEMDNKLLKYANAQPEGSLSADFLELLVFGCATQEIEGFLMDDLTEKGLKKLGISVDLSYSTIQNLVTKPLQSGSINLFFFLNILNGFSRNTFYYKPLLTCEATEEALRCCGAFLMKVLELQQVIDQCVNDMKIFFCWLCVVIARLMLHDLPEETTQVTQEDTIYLAEYLNSLEDDPEENDDGTVRKRKFNLEKVGQYLDSVNLHQIAKDDVHHLWNVLLDENECLRNCTLLFPHDKTLSLIQQRDKLLAAIDNVFKKTDDSICDSFQLAATIVVCNVPDNEVSTDSFFRTSFHINEAAHSDLLVITTNQQNAIIMEMDKAKCVRYSSFHTTPPHPMAIAETMNTSLKNLRFTDLQFYNESTLSLLLQSTADHASERSLSFFVQLSLDALKGKYTQMPMQAHLNLIGTATSHSIHDLVDSNHFRSFDGQCTKIAVSGSRKIAAVLSENMKNITVLELEVDDEEDENDTSHNSTFEISKESMSTSPHE